MTAAAWCREAIGFEYWQAWALVLGFSALAGAWIKALDKRLAPGLARWVGDIAPPAPLAALPAWHPSSPPSHPCVPQAAGSAAGGGC